MEVSFIYYLNMSYFSFIFSFLVNFFTFFVWVFLLFMQEMVVLTTEQKNSKLISTSGWVFFFLVIFDVRKIM